MAYPKVELQNYTEFNALPESHRFRILTMPYKYYAHMMMNAGRNSYVVCSCSSIGPDMDRVCVTCSTKGRSDPRFVVLARDQDTYDVCLWDIDMYTYHTLSLFHKVNRHFDIDFVMQNEGIIEDSPTLGRYVATPVLSSTSVPEFYEAPDGWFDRYLEHIVLADDFCNEKAGREEWGTRTKRGIRKMPNYDFGSFSR